MDAEETVDAGALAAEASHVELVGGPDPELAATMGFSGFGKKARTFDLEAMFEQTRRTAVERSKKMLEARAREEEAQKGKNLRSQHEDVDSAASGSSVMGACSSLTCREAESSESEDSSNEEIIGPPLPCQISIQGPAEDTGGGGDDDDEFIGPPLPPGYKDSDDDDDDDDDMQEEDNNPVKKIPDSHEITLQHGTKTD